jgi:hypothetical protein
MPRKHDREADLLAAKERLRLAVQKLREDQLVTDRQIAQERYRKQRAWEAQVGRLAWNAGLNTLDLSTIGKLLNRLTPADLLGDMEAQPDEDTELVVAGNS